MFLKIHTKWYNYGHNSRKIKTYNWKQFLWGRSQQLLECSWWWDSRFRSEEATSLDALYCGGGSARTLLASTRCLKVIWKEFIVNDNCWIDFAPYIPWSMGIIMILICLLYVTQIDGTTSQITRTLVHTISCWYGWSREPYYSCQILIPKF